MSKEIIMEPETIKDIQDDVADLAEAIVRVADLGDALKSTSLTEGAIIKLLKAKIGGNMPEYEIRAVLDALPRLKEYLK